MAWRTVAAAVLGVWLSAGAGAGELSGRLSVDVAGVDLAALGPTVVFLEGADGAPDLPAPRRPPVLHQRNSRFEPDFLIAVAGQSIRFANDDTIFHNVFSFSRPNDFDLGIYPSGQSRSVRFDHAGVVKVYCSIHESMNATVLVTPTALFDRASPAGAWRLEGVPPGRYVLTVWNERLPAVTRTVEVGDGPARLDVRLGGPTP